MRTYNFIIWDSFGESQFIEINAKILLEEPYKIFKDKIIDYVVELP